MYAYTHKHTCTHARTHAHTYIHTHAHAHTNGVRNLCTTSKLVEMTIEFSIFMIDIRISIRTVIFDA